MDETQIKYPVSYIRDGLASSMIAADHGHIIVDFPIKEIELAKRLPVKHAFKGDRYEAVYSEYIVVAEILNSNGEHLIVPPAYGQCSFAQKQQPTERPASDHVNSNEITNLLNGA